MMRLGELLRKLRWPMWTATSWRHATHRAAEPPQPFWDELADRPGDDDQWDTLLARTRKERAQRAAERRRRLAADAAERGER